MAFNGYVDIGFKLDARVKSGDYLLITTADELVFKGESGD